MTNQVGEAVKDARLHELQALLFAQQQRFNRATIGQTLPVLFEGKGREAGQIFGRTPYMQAVHIRAPEQLMGREAMVKIDSAGFNSLASNSVIEMAIS
jgi:tRNA-2-methylthio-N6-dimethylallyladenosine synthase